MFSVNLTLGDPPIAAVCGISASLVLVTVLALCVCNKKKSNNSALLRKKDVSAGKTHEHDSNGVVLRMSETDVEAGQRNSNGTVPSTGEPSDGRPRSHDRALPDLPSHNMGVMATDDEDDPEDGLYDVIPKKGGKSVKSPQHKSKEVTSAEKNKGKGHHSYEKVSGDPDSDSTYAHIGSDCSYAGVKDLKDTGYAGISDDPDYAGVDGDNDHQAVAAVSAEGIHPHIDPDYDNADVVTEATYAQIDEGKRKSRLIAMSTVNGKSRDSLDPSSAPPIPQKNFDVQEELAVGNMSGASPSLPPRNSVVMMGTNVDGAMAIDMDRSFESPSFSEFINGFSASAMIPDDMMGAAGPVVVDKNTKYSEVTARESLANMRKRQEEEAKEQALRDASDSTYATVDYDLVKTPAPPEASGAARDSSISDLYAEISSAPESQRSSTYAQMSDFTLSTHAPTPPPVEVLKHLSHEISEDELADPGYARIKSGLQCAPSSEMSMAITEKTIDSSAAGAEGSAATPPTNMSKVSDSGQRSPVYAVVNKDNKANYRHSVTDSTPGFTRTPMSYDQDRHSYAEVAPLSVTQASGASSTVDNMKPNNASQNKASGSAVDSSLEMDPDYQTIGNVENRNFDDEEEDPDYASVRGSQVMDNMPPVIMQSDPNCNTSRDKSPEGGKKKKKKQQEKKKDAASKNKYEPDPHIYQEIEEAKQTKHSKGSGKKMKSKKS